MISLHHRLQRIASGYAVIELILKCWHVGIGCFGTIDRQPEVEDDARVAQQFV